ncbi:MAG: hypothetical protein ABL931_05505 [Usitatibacteraceae bacterium]
MNFNGVKRLALASSALAVLAGLSACSEKTNPPINANAPVGSVVTNEPVDPRAQTIGVPPDTAAKNTPETKSNTRSDLSKADEAKSMPMPGQGHAQGSQPEYVR